MTRVFGEICQYVRAARYSIVCQHVRYDDYLSIEERGATMNDE